MCSRYKGQPVCDYLVVNCIYIKPEKILCNHKKENKLTFYFLFVLTVKRKSVTMGAGYLQASIYIWKQNKHLNMLCLMDEILFHCWVTFPPYFFAVINGYITGGIPDIQVTNETYLHMYNFGEEFHTLHFHGATVVESNHDYMNNNNVISLPPKSGNFIKLHFDYEGKWRYEEIGNLERVFNLHGNIVSAEIKHQIS